MEGHTLRFFFSISIFKIGNAFSTSIVGQSSKIIFWKKNIEWKHESTSRNIFFLLLNTKEIGIRRIRRMTGNRLADGLKKGKKIGKKTNAERFSEGRPCRGRWHRRRNGNLTQKKAQKKRKTLHVGCATASRAQFGIYYRVISFRLILFIFIFIFFLKFLFWPSNGFSFLSRSDFFTFSFFFECAKRKKKHRK